MTPRLTEAELDAANAAHFAAAQEYADTLPPLDYAGCNGRCDQGRRQCDCSRAQFGMFDDEVRYPWRWAAFYAAAFVAAVAASVIWPWGVA